MIVKRVSEQGCPREVQRATLVKEPGATLRKVALSIDPGLGGTGVATWDMADESLLHAGLYRSKNKVWYEAAMDIAWQVYFSVEEYDVTLMGVEFPQVFQSTMGMAIANRGDLFKLTFVVGCVRAVLPKSAFSPITVPEWKGQLPKEEVERRCKRILPRKDWVQSHHVWDAIGIGLYMQGKL